MRNVVIRTSDGKVLRHGYEDFASSPGFDSATEDVIASDFVFDPPLSDVDWFYDSETEAFTQEDSLAKAKHDKMEAIDARTNALIFDGFEFPADSGNIFSLSIKAQSYWNGLGNLISTGLLSDAQDFPMTVNLKDDSGVHILQNIQAATQMFAAAAATVKGHLASGTALKNQVRGATSVAEVEAVIDSR